MNIIIKWIGLDESENTKYADVESVELVKCSCGSQCYRLTFIDGNISARLHEVKELITDSRFTGFWAERITTLENGELIESYLLLVPVNMMVESSDIDLAVSKWNQRHKSVHRFKRDSSLFGGYFVDEHHNSYELV